MAVTIDPRPTYFGDRMIITGSYEAGDTSIDLSSLLSSIDFAGVNPSAAQAQLTTTDGSSTDISQMVDNCTVSGTTVTVVSANVSRDPDGGGAGPAVAGATSAGSFFVIGRR